MEFFAPYSGTLEIHLPDAARPLDLGLGPDERLLSIGVGHFDPLPRFDVFLDIKIKERPRDLLLSQVGLTPRELIKRFESVGGTVEFGMAQRELEYDTSGLLCFVDAPPEVIAAALETRFMDLAAPGTLMISQASIHPEYVIEDSVYGLRFHTWRHEIDISQTDLLISEYEMISYRVKEFIADASRGSKLYVYRSHTLFLAESHERLGSALRALGPNKLLVVHDAHSQRPHGTVERSHSGVTQAWIGSGGADWWTTADLWVDILIAALPDL